MVYVYAKHRGFSHYTAISIIKIGFLGIFLAFCKPGLIIITLLLSLDGRGSIAFDRVTFPVNDNFRDWFDPVTNGEIADRVTGPPSLSVEIG